MTENETKIINNLLTTLKQLDDKGIRTFVLPLVESKKIRTKKRLVVQ